MSKIDKVQKGIYKVQLFVRYDLHHSPTVLHKIILRNYNLRGSNDHVEMAVPSLIWGQKVTAEDVTNPGCEHPQCQRMVDLKRLA